MDKIDVLSSMIRPKKLTVQGSDGKFYPFLCKPKDDLRKDAKLMEFNSIVNKLLRKNSQSRRMQLYIRTYVSTIRTYVSTVRTYISTIRTYVSTIRTYVSTVRTYVSTIRTYIIYDITVLGLFEAVNRHSTVHW